MGWSRAKKVSVAMFGFAALSIVGTLLLAKKTVVTLRDPSTLPHVDRPFPKVTSSISLDENTVNSMIVVYENALARDSSMGGVALISYSRDSSGAPIASIQTKSGKMDQGFRWDLQSNPPLIDNSAPPGPITLSFASEMRREPLAPGVGAAETIVRKLYEKAPLEIRAVRPTKPFEDYFADAGKRHREVSIAIDVEFTGNLTYDECDGPVDDPSHAEGNRPPCPTIKHFTGDDITLDDGASFDLEGEEGWKDNRIHRHWYGDEAREVETRKSLF